MRLLMAACLLASLLLVATCGQKGPLHLPDNPPKPPASELAGFKEAPSVA